MSQKSRRPRAIAIARADKVRSQSELFAYGATLAFFAIVAILLFRSF
ncbi:hypothetical protein [Sinorhizobium saheli]|jgi:hypothetical protein|nr:hypothetical protein [Sinorhizobium saheli]